MCKICWISVFVLALMTTGVVYKFVIQGKVTSEADGRTAILLNKQERDLVLSEMRVFLESIQQITSGITDDNMKIVAEYARRSGRDAQMEVPGSLIGKLPLTFKTLGVDTHAKFDGLALAAEQLGDREHALDQLRDLLDNCVACHAQYRFEASAQNP